MSKFYRTIVTVEVLSEQPLKVDDLDDLHHAITTGDCSGKVDFGNSEEVDGPTMAKLLMAQGSDPEFFQLDEHGNPVE